MSNAKSHRIPSYRLHKPTGLGVVRLNGKDFYLGKYRSQESNLGYERLIAELPLPFRKTALASKTAILLRRFTITA